MSRWDDRASWSCWALFGADWPGKEEGGGSEGSASPRPSREDVPPEVISAHVVGSERSKLVSKNADGMASSGGNVDAGSTGRTSNAPVRGASPEPEPDAAALPLPDGRLARNVSYSGVTDCRYAS